MKFSYPSALVALLIVLLPSASWSQEKSSSSILNTAAGTRPLKVVPKTSNSFPSQMKVNSEDSPSYRRYSTIHVDGPYIALTFDDGPSPTLTPRLLDILKEKGVKATFFVIGQNVAHAPEIVARAAAEGHEIGNHSWSHPAFTKISDAQVQEEVTKTSDAIFQVTGKKPTLLRPPYGAINPHLGRLIEQQDGLKIVLWSVDPLDWKSPGSHVVAQRIIASAKPGDIILSHDIKPGTVEAMPAVIDALKAKGYQFVTVSELIALETKKPPVTSIAAKSVVSSQIKSH